MPERLDKPSSFGRKTAALQRRRENGEIRIFKKCKEGTKEEQDKWGGLGVRGFYSPKP
jgi:hypothetical protein